MCINSVCWMYKSHSLYGNLVLFRTSLVYGYCELMSLFTAATGWLHSPEKKKKEKIKFKIP